MNKDYMNGFSDAIKLVKYSIFNLENVNDIKNKLDEIETAVNENQIQKLKEELLLL